MRMSLLWVLVVGVVSLPFATDAHAAERELFVNGGFEEGLAGWRPLNQSGNTTFRVDTSEKAEGKQSLRIERSTQGDRDFLKQSAQLPPHKKKAKVHVFFRYKAAKKSRFVVDVYFFDAADNTIGRGNTTMLNGKATKKFTKAKKSFEIPKRAAGFGINVMLSTPAVVWLDDVHVTCDVQGNVLANPGFEEGLVGWGSATGTSGGKPPAVTSKTRARGKQSLLLERTSPRLFPESGVMGTVVLEPKSKKVQLAFGCRQADGAQGSVVIQIRNEGGVVIASKRVDAAASPKAFGENQVEWELPEDSYDMQVVLQAGGPGRVWFDDLKLKVK